MDLQDQRSKRRRQLLLPLVVLVAAVGIAFWASQRELRRIDEARTMILGLCKVAALDEDLTGRIQSDPLVAQRVSDSLRQICAEPDVLPDLQVEVFSGDLDETVVRSGMDPANFSAIVRVAGVDRLGLRLRHEGDPRHIIVLGYWLP
jgi:hypothetical protein